MMHYHDNSDDGPVSRDHTLYPTTLRLVTWQVRLATFSQHHVDGLDLALTPLQYMMRCFPGTKDEQQRCEPRDLNPALHTSIRHSALR